MSTTSIFDKPFLESFDQIFLEPYRRSARSFQVAWYGRSVESIESSEKMSTIIERVGAAVIGLILLIPIINAIVFAILKALDGFLNPPVSDDSKKKITPSNPSQEESVVTSQSNIQNNSLQSSAIVKEESLIDLSSLPKDEKVSDEEYQKRRNDCLDNCGKYNFKPHQAIRAKWNPDILTLTIDQVLQKYADSYEPALLSEFYDLGDVPEDQRKRLDEHFAAYEAAKLQYSIASKQTLSRIYGFLNSKQYSFLDTAKENCFKAEIKKIFDQILNAHRNSLRGEIFRESDYLELRNIEVDITAHFEVTSGTNAASFGEYLHKLAAYGICKHKWHNSMGISHSPYDSERDLWAHHCINWKKPGTFANHLLNWANEYFQFDQDLAFENAIIFLSSLGEPRHLSSHLSSGAFVYCMIKLGIFMPIENPTE